MKIPEEKVLVESFKKWLATQNDKDEVNYLDSGKCLFARFLKWLCPQSVIWVGGKTFDLQSNSYYIPDEIAFKLIALPTIFTMAEAKVTFLT